MNDAGSGCVAPGKEECQPFVSHHVPECRSRPRPVVGRLLVQNEEIYVLDVHDVRDRRSPEETFGAVNETHPVQQLYPARVHVAERRECAEGHYLQWFPSPRERTVKRDLLGRAGVIIEGGVRVDVRPALRHRMQLLPIYGVYMLSGVPLDQSVAIGAHGNPRPRDIIRRLRLSSIRSGTAFRAPNNTGKINGFQTAGLSSLRSWRRRAKRAGLRCLSSA